MIRSVRHKGLKRFIEDDDRKGLPADIAERIREILTTLEEARTIDDMNLRSFRLHPLKGSLKGFYAVTIRANWRIIFRYHDGDASDVDMVDYH